jgi:hypothetical protein
LEVRVLPWTFARRRKIEKTALSTCGAAYCLTVRLYDLIGRDPLNRRNGTAIDERPMKNAAPVMAAAFVISIKIGYDRTEL